MKTPTHIARARPVVEKFYHGTIKRHITDDEIEAEIVNIRRRKEQGTLDDFYERLAAALEVAGIDL